MTVPSGPRAGVSPAQESREENAAFVIQLW